LANQPFITSPAAYFHPLTILLLIFVISFVLCSFHKKNKENGGKVKIMQIVLEESMNGTR